MWLGSDMLLVSENLDLSGTIASFIELGPNGETQVMKSLLLGHTASAYIWSRIWNYLLFKEIHSIFR